MFENIFETVVKGSNTIFLDVNQDDYFLSYETLSRKAAEEITENYFRMKQKDGTPDVIEVAQDPYSHTIKITVDVTCDPKKNYNHEPNSAPDILNVTRNQ